MPLTDASLLIGELGSASSALILRSGVLGVLGVWVSGLTCGDSFGSILIRLLDRVGVVGWSCDADSVLMPMAKAGFSRSDELVLNNRLDEVSVGTDTLLGPATAFCIWSALLSRVRLEDRRSGD